MLAVGVFGGVWVQKQLGGSAAASGFPSGPPPGMPGGGEAGGGRGPSDARRALNRAASARREAETPVVVGTVTSIKGKRLIVTDLGENRHQVTVSTETTLTTPYAHGDLKRGDTVSIVGTESGDDVAATAITIR